MMTYFKPCTFLEEINTNNKIFILKGENYELQK